MSTSTPPPASGAAGTAEAPRAGGPRVSGDQMRDVNRLRRSSTDRYVAGVAGGLGRHFDLDPTVIRVTLVVLTLFGGAGVVIYAAVWLFVPQDGKDRAVIDVRGDILRVLLIVVGVFALSMVFGTPFFDGGWNGTFPLLVLGLIAVAIYATRQQRQSSPPPPEGTTMTVTDHPSGPSGYGTTDPTFGHQPPAWTPPPVPAYVPPPRPRRTGPVLFWPTLALIAIAMGVLGIVDNSQSVIISAYPVLALAITGVMLLVGAYRGRPGGLIALGLLSVVALMITSAIASAPNGSHSSDTVRYAPMNAGEVRSTYSLGTGSIELDLTRLRDPEAMLGRTIQVSIGAGEVTVLVPRSLDTHVRAKIRMIGAIDIDDRQYEGFSQSVSTTLPGATGVSGSDLLDLGVRARLGEITVEQR